jgi:hypothetical protein
VTDQTTVLRRQLRLMALLAAAQECGLSPVSARQLHTLAYLADALAPVWRLDILDAHLLKRKEGPLSPAVQRDIDSLVGIGVIVPSSVTHVEDSEGRWRLDADYELNEEFASGVFEAVTVFELQRNRFTFAREVVFAASGLADQIQDIAAIDLTYGDVLVGTGGVVNIAPDDDELNATSVIALRFGELMAHETSLTSAEKIHMYVQELYKRIESAA